jgi:ubiquinone biosynthesis accessory factor UbiJ
MQQGRCQNRAMLNSLKALAVPAATQRLTLLLNHVLASEPVAVERLRKHAGRRIVLRLERWPALLPEVPPLAFFVTSAGLLEWEQTAHAGFAAPADLQVSVDAANPALMMVQGLAGRRPRIQVGGDAALAGDVDWLFENLRWDVQDDLARLVGDVPAREMARFGAAVAGALRTMVRGAARFAPRSADPPAR